MEAPLTALRLLQLCGVNKFGHVISAVPPAIIRMFAEARDVAVVQCLEAVQQYAVTEQSTHALPVGAGGAKLHSLVRHGAGSHLGTYYRIAGPLIARLLLMGGPTPRKAAAHLLNPSDQVHGGGWARHLLDAHKAAVDLQESFSRDELQMAFLLAPRGIVITLPGDPRNVAKELPPTVGTDVLPLGPISPGGLRGIKHIADGIRRLSD